MADHCIECATPVTTRQEALVCDECGLWNHRTCNTRVDRPTYRALARGEQELEWRCRPCRVYVFGSNLEASGKSWTSSVRCGQQ